MLEISTAAPTFLKNGGFSAAPNVVFFRDTNTNIFGDKLRFRRVSDCAVSPVSVPCMTPLRGIVRRIEPLIVSDSARAQVTRRS